MDNKIFNWMALFLAIISWQCSAEDTVTINCRTENSNFYNEVNSYLKEDKVKNFIIQGNCRMLQPLIIFKSGVSLIGEDQSSIISGGVIITNGVSNVKIKNLTLTGDFAALIISNNAFATIYNSLIYNSNRGVSAFYGGTVRLINSTIVNNTQGLVVGTNSNAILEGSKIEQNKLGVQLFANGVLTLEKSLDSGNVSTVNDNIDGIYASSGGTLRPVNAQIMNNQQKGIYIFDGGMLFLSQLYTVQIINNKTGIVIDNSIVPDLSIAKVKLVGNQENEIECRKIWNNEKLKLFIAQNQLDKKVTSGCLN